MLIVIEFVLELRPHGADLPLLVFDAASNLRGDLAVAFVYVVSIPAIVVENHEFLVNDIPNFLSVDLTVTSKAHVHQLLF